MRLLTLVVLVLIVIMAAPSLKADTNPGLQAAESQFDTYVLFSQTVKLDPGVLTAHLSQRWGVKATCVKDSRLNEDKVLGYVLTDKECSANSAKVRVAAKPMQSELTQYILARNTGIISAEVRQTLAHAAHIHITLVHNNTESIKRAEYVAKVLEAVSQMPDAIGYVNTEAQLYLPKSRLDPILASGELTIANLIPLFVKTDLAEDNRGWVVHTHGLGHFGSPDVEVVGVTKDRFTYFAGLFLQTAVQVLKTGEPLKAGQHIKANGEEISYRLTNPTFPGSKHFGKFDVLDLVKQ